MESQPTSSSTGQSPAVRVFENGKEVPPPTPSAIPHVLNWVYQSIAAAEAIKLRKLEESKVPTGTYSEVILVSDVPLDIDAHPPWICFSIINAGPGAVMAEVTESNGALSSSAPIPAGGAKNVDFHYAVITKVSLVAAPGTTASVTVAAVRGKKP